MVRLPSEPGPAARPELVPGRAFATLFVTLFLDLVAFGIIIPVLPFFAEAYGASAQVVTLLSTAFSLAQFVASPVLGRISDRFGRRPVMLVSIAGGVVSMLMLGFATTLTMVFAARIVNGFANANIATAHAYVADRVPPAQRARYMGMMGAAIGLGFVFGPVIGGLLSTQNMPHLPFLVAAGLGAANWLMAWRWLPESHRADRSPDAPVMHRGSGWQQSKRALLRTPLGLVVIINFAFFLTFSAMESTFALAAEAKFGWGARETGYLFTMIGVVIFITQGMLVGRTVARFGERGTLTAGLVILSVGLTAAGLSPNVAILAVGSAGIALGNGLINPSLSALVSRVSSAEDQGLGMGLKTSGAALGRVIGPVGAGFAFELVSPAMPFVVGAAVLWVVCLPLTRALRSRIDDSDSQTDRH
jgi:multidrug resistance protein